MASKKKDGSRPLGRRGARGWTAPGVALAALLAVCPPAAAQRDPEPPSQQVRTDAEVPVYVVALTGDALQAALGLYAVRLDWALSPHHLLTARTGWEQAGERPAALLEVGYALAPLGDGVEGLLLGVSVATLIGREGAVAGRLGAELAYQHVWGGVALGAAFGADRHLGIAQGEADRWRLRARLFLGWAWR